MKNKLLLAVPTTILALPTLAIFTNETPPAWRGAPDTEYAGWECFTVPFGGVNFPDDPDTTTDDAVLEQLSPGGIITSTCNIYNPGVPPAYVLTDNVPMDLQEVWLQLRTQGNPLDFASIQLNFMDAGGSIVSLPPSATTMLFGGGGAPEEWLFEWDLTAEGTDITSYELTWTGSDANMSLDNVALDTRFNLPGVGTPYCTSTANSTGQASAISAAGSASISANDLVLSADNLPAQPGIFIGGPTQAQIPLFNGFLCVDPNGLQRFAAVNTPVGGVITEAVDLATSAPGGLNVAAGSVFNYQRWNRDPAGGGGNANFSNGVAVQYMP